MINARPLTWYTDTLLLQLYKNWTHQGCPWERTRKGWSRKCLIRKHYIMYAFPCLYTAARFLSIYCMFGISLILSSIKTWAEAGFGFGFTKPAFLGSRLRLPRFLRAWLRLRDFQRLRLRLQLRGLPKLRIRVWIWDVWICIWLSTNSLASAS